MAQDKPRREYCTGEEYAQIRQHIRTFERIVWFGSLFNHVNSTSCRGQSGHADGLGILVWTCAGRTMITIRDGTGDWVSLMVAEDSRTPTMGLHGRSVDMPTLIDWLSRLCSHYNGVVDSESVTLDILAS